jgi:hypothetical protein
VNCSNQDRRVRAGGHASVVPSRCRSATFSGPESVTRIVMHLSTSILFLLSLLSATPSRDLKLSGRPPSALLTPGLLTPRFTPIATRDGGGTGRSVSRSRMQGGKTGAGLKRLRAREGAWFRRSQIVPGPRRGPDELLLFPHDGNDQAIHLSAQAYDEESEEDEFEGQEQACLALIEGPIAGSFVLLPRSFPTLHACLSIDRIQSPRGPP